jgi:hypothetical protein
LTLEQLNRLLTETGAIVMLGVGCTTLDLHEPITEDTLDDSVYFYDDDGDQGFNVTLQAMLDGEWDCDGVYLEVETDQGGRMKTLKFLNTRVLPARSVAETGDSGFKLWIAAWGNEDEDGFSIFSTEEAAYKQVARWALGFVDSLETTGEEETSELLKQIPELIAAKQYEKCLELWNQWKAGGYYEQCWMSVGNTILDKEE